MSVVRRGDAYDIVAIARIQGDPRIVWATLTDYERLPQFVPGLEVVRVLERRHEANREHLVIEQIGALNFFVFVRRVVVRLEVEHLPPVRIDARAVLPSVLEGAAPEGGAADRALVAYRSFSGTYLLEPLPGGVRLAYHATLVPAEDLLPLLGPLVVRENVVTQFGALLEEIEKRLRAAEPALR